MNKLQIFIFLLIGIFIKSGYSIRCYSCEAPIKSGCSDIKRNKDIQSEKCEAEKIAQNTESALKDIAHMEFFKDTEHEVLMVCQKIVATNNYTKETIINRGCQLDGGNADLCTIFKQKAKSTNLTIEYCSVCTQNDCNSSKQLQVHVTRSQMLAIFGFISVLYKIFI